MAANMKVNTRRLGEDIAALSDRLAAMQRTAAEIVGDFMTEILGEEMKPWQNAENEGTGASI